jgi:hydrogenase maturation protease
MRKSAAVIGVGNPLRGDDGAGWAVIDELQRLGANGSLWRKSGAGLLDILDLFDVHSTVYIADACEIAAPVGSWLRIDALTEPVLTKQSFSTHGWGLGEIISLAQTLHRLPDRLIVYAIASHEWSLQNCLSSSVEVAVKQVAIEIDQEIR